MKGRSMDCLTLFVYSTNGAGLANLGQACQEFMELHPGLLKPPAFSELDLGDEKKREDLLARIKATENKVLIVRLHGGKDSCSCFERLIEAGRVGRVFIEQHVNPDKEVIRRFYPETETPEFVRIMEYLQSTVRPTGSTCSIP